MKFGALFFPTDLSMRPDALGRELEERGFESLWVTEHTHIPASRRTPWPGGPDMPEQYRRTLDPIVALTAAAVATSTLRLATGICLVAQHDPIVLAKATASLDLLSGGRFTLGVGVGWNIEEMENHGVDPRRRRSIAREKILAMKALWTEEVASFEGDHVSFEPSWAWPKPVQDPHPPVVVGAAAGPLTFAHVIEYADGWMPIHGRRDVLPAIDDLRKAAEEAGRDPSSIELGVFGVPGEIDIVRRYQDAGIVRCVLTLPSAPTDLVLRALDELRPTLDLAG